MTTIGPSTPLHTGDFLIRRLEAHEWPQYRVIRLRSLADAPDAFGSTLAAEQALAADTWSARLARAAVSGRDYPIVAERANQMVGLMWAKFDADDGALVNLFQVWVAPESRGHGVAARMLREVIGWAKAQQARSVHLDVTCGDSAAMRLYQREGFRPAGAAAPLRDGSHLLSQPMRLELGWAPD